MNNLGIAVVLGIVIGAVDVLPMIKMKLDRYSIVSAFMFYLILPFIIFNMEVQGLIWWLKGGLIGFLLALPTILIVAKEDKKSVPPMLVMSVVLGTVIGIAAHYLI